MKKGAFRYNGIGSRPVQCCPAEVIHLSNQDEILRHRNGDTDDIIETIMRMDADSGRWIRDDAAQCLRGDTEEDTLRNVWAFVKRHNRYRPDRNHERVKSPGALFTSGFGDCKSYSIATAGLLRALGIRYRYRFAAYDGGDYTHVYIVAKTKNGWVPVDAVYERPLSEAAYHHKTDMAPRAAAVAGIAGASDTGAGIDWKNLALMGLILWIAQ